MARILSETVIRENGRIRTKTPELALAGELEQGNIVILREAVDPALCRAVRQATSRWHRSAQPTNPSAPRFSYHRIDDCPPNSETPHCFHISNFITDSKGNPKLEGGVTPDPCFAEAFKICGDIQNRITGTHATFEADQSGYFLRPQIVRYPSGGGFFDRHIHPLMPQKVGIILSLSERGKDFQTGGTRFWVGDQLLDAEQSTNIGDICMFRFDLYHDVSPVDSGSKQVDWNADDGRWTLVMPLWKPGAY
ncbi:MAG: hypothetical protein ACXWPM_04230 [Bdellovibrionota bacterium]